LSQMLSSMECRLKERSDVSLRLTTIGVECLLAKIVMSGQNVGKMVVTTED
jgi:hypothetical protein